MVYSHGGGIGRLKWPATADTPARRVCNGPFTDTTHIKRQFK